MTYTIENSIDLEIRGLTIIVSDNRPEEVTGLFCKLEDQYGFKDVSDFPYDDHALYLGGYLKYVRSVQLMVDRLDEILDTGRGQVSNLSMEWVNLHDLATLLHRSVESEFVSIIDPEYTMCYELIETFTEAIAMAVKDGFKCVLKVPSVFYLMCVDLMVKRYGLIDRYNAYVIEKSGSIRDYTSDIEKVYEVFNRQWVRIDAELDIYDPPGD